MNEPQGSVEKIIKSYIGFLEGTGKSRLTISSYRGDLDVFREFIREEGVNFFDLRKEDFEKYHFFLQERGLKTNTRRRKLITARSLCRYALTRKKIKASPAQFIKPPERLERIPWVPSPEEFQAFQDSILTKSPIGQRNSIVIRLLAETALSVSELCSLRWEDIDGRTLKVPGKKSRSLSISNQLQKELRAWRTNNDKRFLFPGYNRHGMATERMSPRGVEIMFLRVAKAAGLEEMKPKTLRHFAILAWLREGVADSEMQRRLGVSSGYSFHAYKKFLEK